VNRGQSALEPSNRDQRARIATFAVTFERGELGPYPVFEQRFSNVVA